MPTKTGGRRRGWILGISLVLAVSVAVVATVAFLASRPEPSRAAGTSGDIVATSAPVSASPSIALSPEDFDLKVKILEKQCFGSAGCNVTYQIEVAAYDGPSDVGDQRFRVVYEVRGGEDGPQVNNLIFEGDSYSYDEEETIQTRPRPRLTARVTDVVEERIAG